MSSIKANIVRDPSTQWVTCQELLTEVLSYADEHRDDNIDRLYLGIANHPHREILTHAVDQILARRKYHSKLSNFIDNKAFIFPSILSAEQSTHQAVAQYHSRLFGKNKAILDLTAGLGIDAMTAARHNAVTACELDPLKVAALGHNASTLNLMPIGLNGLSVFNTDSLEYLKNRNTNYDIIFADPARRGDLNTRVYNPSDCVPDVVGNNDFLLSRTERLIIKHSPMLDITQACKLFPRLKTIHIICLKGELKEILTEQKRGYQGPTEVICVNIVDENEISLFQYNLPHDYMERTSYADITNVTAGKYIYIPNAAVMKSGAWGQLTHSFPELIKLDPNTHIFVSDTYLPVFPGRIIQIDDIPEKKKYRLLKGEKFNVVCRNYIMQAPELEKKLKVTPGGDKYIIGCKCNGHSVLLCGHIVNSHYDKK